MSAVVIYWQDPPAGTAAPKTRDYRLTKWEQIADLLRSKPRTWAIVESFGPTDFGDHRDRARAAATARNITVGLYKGCAHLEACFAKVGEVWNVYARYVGGAP
jgi:hypothetical protein